MRSSTVVYGKMDKGVDATDHVDQSDECIGLWKRWNPGLPVLSVTRSVRISDGCDAPRVSKRFGAVKNNAFDTIELPIGRKPISAL